MANPGDANSVGAVNVDVGANLDPLIQGLEQAKQTAQQKGEEIGKAAAEGMAQGASSAPASAPGGGQPPVDNMAWLAAQRAKFDAASAEGVAARGAATEGGLGAALGGGGGLGAAAGAVGIAGAITVAAKMFEEAAKKIAESNFEMGQKIGDLLFQTHQQMLELKQAISINSEMSQKSANLREAEWQRMAAGNPMIGTGVFEQTESLAAKNEALAAEQAEAGSGVLRRGATRLIKGLAGGVFGMWKQGGEMIDETSEMLGRRGMIDANRDTIEANREQTDPIMKREREQRLTGSLQAEEMRRRGMTVPAGLENAGVFVPTVGVDSYRESLGRQSDKHIERTAFWTRASVMEKRDEIRNRHVERP